MKLLQCFFLIVLLVLLNYSCNQQDKKVASTEEYTYVPNWEKAQNFYLTSIEHSIALLDQLKEKGFQSDSAVFVFKKLRQEFKKAEPYASYLNPEVGHRVNGPALPIFKEDNFKTLAPVGLQKIEESVFEKNESQQEFDKEVYVTRGLMDNLRKNIIKRELNPQRFFMSTHQQLLRIISLGITGFDTPISHYGLQESMISLQGLQYVYNSSIRAIILKENKALDTSFQQNIDKAIQFLEANDDFETFDRYTFLREYMNPLTRDWVSIRKTSGLWEGIDSSPFNFDAPTFFENNAFNVTHFTPSVNRNPSEAQISLGKKLFFEPKLSKQGNMACATCHLPEKAYADHVRFNNDNANNELLRNTPTLINVVYQKGFFWDGRSATLLDQISSVFTNKKEFNTSVHEFSSDIINDTTYVNLFKEAYGEVSNRNIEVVKAISSYISTLNSFDSKFDRNIRGEENSLSSQEKLGFNLFAGKALCATCHFIPLTNGTVPPFYAETEKEVIGVPETSKNNKLDDDLGYYWKFEEELHKGMFKTPTVRNAGVTAPYMHNGVYDSLEQVMDFYNKGGGAGLGFDLPHQTLPFDNLNLTQEEQTALVAFIHTLTDTSVEDDMVY
ncbi:cytochrome-c peroxidase [Aquimarina brevivitae]|uniref:Cytochrome c peroxidase n=1 Tax=Aquimarina brevivitae TaxID=323412 RepID=A0A4Q7P1D3_9FLAO|nr:cytochrome c peroxidase [Aquimarina brevivitae]RZS93646.1 cytochrome c peroxidase [Aquimarina brevivitae]